jgi:hypothetical protein
LILFVSLCIVLRVSGTALDFIARWTTKMSREVPEPLSLAPTANDS